MKLFLLLLISACYTAHSQGVSLYGVDATNFPTVEAKFLVVDGKGNRVETIGPAHFEVIEYGEQRTVTEVVCPEQKPPKSLSIAMSFDISCSMNWGEFYTPRIWVAQDCARELCRIIQAPPSEFALLATEEENYVIKDFTSDTNALFKSIDRIRAWNGHNIVEQLLNPETGLVNVAKTGRFNRIAIIFTDGELPELHPTEIQRCIDTCVAYDVKFYAVIHSEKGPNRGLVKSLQQIANATGGRLFDEITSSVISKLIAQNIKRYNQDQSACTVKWESVAPCEEEVGITDVRITLAEVFWFNERYLKPETDTANLEFSPSTIDFTELEIGKTYEQKVVVTAKNAPFNVQRIRPSNTEFSVNPASFTLKPGQSQELTISYTPVSGGYSACAFGVINNRCYREFFARSTSRTTTKPPANPTLELTFPNGGERLIVGSDTVIRWSGVTKQDLVQLEFSSDSGENWSQIDTARGLSYNWKNIPRAISDGCLMRVRHIRDRDSTSDDSVRVLTGHRSYVFDATFSPDACTLATGEGSGGNIKFWDVATGELLLPSGAYGWIYSMAFSPDGKILAYSGEYSLDLLDLSSGQSRGLGRSYSDVRGVAFSPDGAILASTSSSGVVLWDVQTREEIDRLSGGSKAWSVAISPDGSIIAAGGATGRISVWDLNTKKSKIWLNGHARRVFGIDFSPDGKILASAGEDSTVKLWDMTTGKEIRTLTGHTDVVRSVNFSPDGKLLASSSGDTTIRFWDVATGQETRILRSHTSMVPSVEFSPDGSVLASASFDNTAILWKLREQSLQQDPSDSVFSIVSPRLESRDISFGDVLINTSRDSLFSDFLRNTGGWDVRVDSVYFTGDDADAFSLLTEPPLTLDSNATQYGEFRFTPNRIGNHSAEIVIVTQADTLQQTISGVGREQAVEIVTSLIDFGQVSVGTFKDTLQTTAIRNVGSTPLTIVNTEHGLPNLDDFSTIAGGGSFTLQPGEEQRIDLRFAPSDVGRTSGTLFFYHDGFGSPAIVRLYGHGIFTGTAYAALNVDSTSAYPGEEIDVRIVIDSSENLSLARIAVVNAYLQFNPTLLAPLGHTAETVDAKTARIYFGNLKIDEKPGTVLSTVRFKVGLGNAENCELAIVDLEPVGGDANLSVSDGMFRLLGVCHEGGARLINPNSAEVALSIYPNPTSNVLTLEFDLIEKGGAELQIFDRQGRSIYNATIHAAPGLVHVELDIHQVPNGIYTVVLQTPNITATQHLQVVK